MKKNIKVPYALKKLALGAAVVALPVFTSCSKDEPDEPIVQHDTEYTFTNDNLVNIDPFDKIIASADSAQVRNVYIVPVGAFVNFATKNINNLINNGLRPATELSPKVKGRGNFEFKPGVAVAADSLWLVQQGWTVNKR